MVKKLSIEKKLQKLKYSIFRNNDIIIKIRFLVIMPNVTSTATLDLASVSLN